MATNRPDQPRRELALRRLQNQIIQLPIAERRRLNLVMGVVIDFDCWRWGERQSSDQVFGWEASCDFGEDFEIDQSLIADILDGEDVWQGHFMLLN